MLDEPLSLVDEADDEDRASPLLPLLVLLSALLLVPSPLAPSPPEVESSLMSLALLLTMLVSSMGRFLLARADGLASSSAVVSETFLGLPLWSFFAVLSRFGLAPSFFFLRFGFFLLLDLPLADDVLGGPFVATCDIGTELVLDDPRLRCWRDSTSCCSIWFCCSKNCISSFLTASCGLWPDESDGEGASYVLPSAPRSRGGIDAELVVDEREDTERMLCR